MAQELPEFDFYSSLQQYYQHDVFSYIMAGASAPSNSLLAASLETMSYKANALTQYANAQAPNPNDLMQKLMYAYMGAGASFNLGVFYDGIDYAPDTIQLENSFYLGLRSARYRAEQTFLCETAKFRKSFFEKGLKLDKSFCKKFLTETGSFAEGPGDALLQNVKIVDYYLLQQNDENLSKYFISNEDIQLQASDLPGFYLLFVFYDNSELTIYFRIDAVAYTLMEAKVIAITGTAAEVLGYVVKKRASGFWSDIIPLTESELTIMRGLHGEKAVKDRIEHSFKCCGQIKDKLGSI